MPKTDDYDLRHQLTEVIARETTNFLQHYSGGINYFDQNIGDIFRQIGPHPLSPEEMAVASEFIPHE